MPDPDWLAKLKAEGRATERGVNLPALTAALAPPAALPEPAYDFKTEAEFQKEVVNLAHLFGWRVGHFRKVRVQRGKRTYWETPVAADGAGFPDLELVRDRLVKAELKVGKNKRSAEQLAWAAAYQRAGVEYYVWYPRDWPTIREVLK